MRLRVESHQYAETILEGRFPAEWEELRDALGTIDPPLRPAGPYTRIGRPKTPKRQARTIGGRRASALMPVDQSALNEAIDRALVARG